MLLTSAIIELTRPAVVFAAALLGACFLPGMGGTGANEAPPVSLTAATAQAASAAPVLPILMLRVARDDLALESDDRAAVEMLLEEAEAKSRTIVHARAAFLEVLAEAVEAGAFDEGRLALHAEHVAWAAQDATPALRTAVIDLFKQLTGEQRLRLVALVDARVPSWAPAWAAEREHRWVGGFPAGKLPDFEGDLVRMARGWTVMCSANVRAVLPRLNASSRRALAASLRTGTVE